MNIAEIIDHDAYTYRVEIQEKSNFFGPIELSGSYKQTYHLKRFPNYYVLIYLSVFVIIIILMLLCVTYN